MKGKVSEITPANRGELFGNSDDHCMNKDCPIKKGTPFPDGYLIVQVQKANGTLSYHLSCAKRLGIDYPEPTRKKVKTPA